MQIVEEAAVNSGRQRVLSMSSMRKKRPRRMRRSIGLPGRGRVTEVQVAGRRRSKAGYDRGGEGDSARRGRHQRGREGGDREGRQG